MAIPFIECCQAIDLNQSVSTRLFREESLAQRNNRQQLDHLLNATAPHERITLAGITSLLVVLLFWCLFGSIGRGVTVDGMVVKAGVRHPVVSSASGVLLEYLVTPGDRVMAGAAIARQTVPDLDREAGVLADRVELLELQVAGSGPDNRELNARLDSARTALLDVKVQHTVKELLVSPVDGEVTPHRFAPGAYLLPGSKVAHVREIQPAGDPPLSIVLRVAKEAAEQLRPGMPASVELVMADREQQTLQGEVVMVEADALAGGLEEPPAGADAERYRVDIRLHHQPDVLEQALEGLACRVRIDLGRSRPLALLGADRILKAS